MTIPPDNYIGEPGYPAPWATTLPREGLRDSDAARIVSLAPDVCRSPTVPVPYPVVDFCGHDANYTPSVRFTEQKAMVLRSHTTDVHGGEPGVGKGVKSGTVGGISEPIGYASQVNAEGSPVIRHLDQFYMNNRNTVGEAIFVRDVRTYPAPLDTDPLPGSIVMSDASPEPLIMGAQYAQALPQQQPRPGPPTPPPPTPNRVPSTRPPGPLPDAANDNDYRRRGTYGRPVSGAATRILGLLGLASAGYELGDMAGRWYVGPDGVMGRAIGNHLRGQVRIGTPQADAVGDLPWHLSEIFSDNLNILNANDLLSLKAGYAVDFRTMDPAELEKLINDPWPSAEQISRNAKTRTQPKPTPLARPVPMPDNSRVDRAVCYPLTVTFTTPMRGTVGEMRRQLALQQTVLNTKNPCQAAADIAKYPVNKPIGEAARRAARTAYINQNAAAIRLLRPNLTVDEARAIARAAATNKDAIHTLDMVAGGNPVAFSGLGGSSENRSIGSQWGPGGKAATLAAYAADQCRNRCPRMQVQLSAT